jgi:hypothetical protein
MCLAGRPPAAPSPAAEAIEMARTALGWLACRPPRDWRRARQGRSQRVAGPLSVRME